MGFSSTHLYFDDLEVGQEWVSGGRTVTESDIVTFAGFSGDFNPIHLDPEFARAAGFGGNILHGMCTMAFATEAVQAYLEDPSRLRAIKVRFSRPVAIGETLTFTVTVTRVEAGRVFGEVAALDSKGQEVLKGGAFEAEA